MLDVNTYLDIGKFVTLIGGVYSIFITFRKFGSTKIADLRGKFKHALRFIDNDNWKNMPDYLLELGYSGISGYQLTADEIRFFLNKKRPLSNLADFVRGYKFLTFIELEDGSFSVGFKQKFDERKRRLTFWISKILYVIFAMMALVPFLFLTPLLLKDIGGFIFVTISSVSFGALAYLNLLEYFSLKAAERVVSSLSNS